MLNLYQQWNISTWMESQHVHKLGNKYFSELFKRLGSYLGLVLYVCRTVLFGDAAVAMRPQRIHRQHSALLQCQLPLAGDCQLQRLPSGHVQLWLQRVLQSENTHRPLWPLDVWWELTLQIRSVEYITWPFSFLKLEEVLCREYVKVPWRRHMTSCHCSWGAEKWFAHSHVVGRGCRHTDTHVSPSGATEFPQGHSDMD